jgi:hypothetical protein
MGKVEEAHFPARTPAMMGSDDESNGDEVIKAEDVAEVIELDDGLC